MDFGFVTLGAIPEDAREQIDRLAADNEMQTPDDRAQAMDNGLWAADDGAQAAAAVPGEEANPWERLRMLDEKPLEEGEQGYDVVFAIGANKYKAVADAIIEDFTRHGIRCCGPLLPYQAWDAIRIGLRTAKILVYVGTNVQDPHERRMMVLAAAVYEGMTVVPFRLAAEGFDTLGFHMGRKPWQEFLAGPLKESIEWFRKYVAQILQAARTWAGKQTTELEIALPEAVPGFPEPETALPEAALPGTMAVAEELSSGAGGTLMEQNPATPSYFYDYGETPSFGSAYPRNHILSIVFLSHLPSDKGIGLDVSLEQDGSVYAWFEERCDLIFHHDGYYDLIIAADGKIRAPAHSERLFAWYENLESIQFQDNFDTSQVTDFAFMFYRCKCLTELDLHGFCTEKARNMSFMFSECVNLKELDLSSFDTKKVRSMDGMFDSCEYLEKLDVRSFDTGNVVDMSLMFSDCECLKELDVSGFDTKNVADFRKMFSWCTSLEELDVSGFGTKFAVDMIDMFEECICLESLDLRNWDFSSVEADDMFRGCRELKLYVDPSERSRIEELRGALHDAEVEFIEYAAGAEFPEEVFGGPGGTLMEQARPEEGIPALDFWELPSFGSAYTRAQVSSISFSSRLPKDKGSGLDVSLGQDGSVYAWFEKNSRGLYDLTIASEGVVRAPANSQELFAGYEKLRTLRFHGSFDTSQVVDFSAMFADCESLGALDVRGFDTGNAENMYAMFESCASLRVLDVSGFETKNVTNMGSMFYDCERLKVLDVRGFNTRNVTNMESMFRGCNDLETLDVSGFNTRNVTSMDWMFDRCCYLKALDVSHFDTGEVTSMDGMFSFCSSLEELDLRGFDTGNVTSMDNMFESCRFTKNLDVSRFDTSHVCSMEYMFRRCEFPALDVRAWDFSYLVSADFMFEGSRGKLYTDPARPGYSRFEGEIRAMKSLKTLSCDVEFVTKPRGEGGTLMEQKRPEGNHSPGGLPSFGSAYDRRQVSSIAILPYIPLGWGDGLDVSLEQDGSVQAWFYKNSKGLYDLTIAADGVIRAPAQCRDLFAGYYNLRTLDFHDSFDTSNARDMRDMFSESGDVLTLDLHGFDTKNVRNFHGMFSGCVRLERLDVSAFDTGNAEDMAFMFSDCYALSALDVSGFDTKNVKDMAYMFQGCYFLEALDVGSFDTGKVKDMSNMFEGCECLGVLDVGSFDTKNVEDMSAMFHKCTDLHTLDLRGFDTGNVTDMGQMFAGCIGLCTLELGTFHTGKVRTMWDMFSGCMSLQALDVGGFDTKNVESMARMFNFCTHLPVLDVSGFDTGKVEDMDYMFLDCDALKELDLRGWDFSSVRQAEDMFADAGPGNPKLKLYVDPSRPGFHDFIKLEDVLWQAKVEIIQAELGSDKENGTLMMQVPEKEEPPAERGESPFPNLYAFVN